MLYTFGHLNPTVVGSRREKLPPEPPLACYLYHSKETLLPEGKMNS